MGSFISGVGDLFGGAANNAGFTAQGVPLQQPSTVDQANQSYGQAQQGLGQQQQLLQALQGQNGIQNQSQVFAQQQALANQLQQQANGGGPNPALAQLSQVTGQNVSNQAALMAGQRGAGANPALLARQAAQQGAGIQQQAVGQGAIMQAQQQLAAQQALAQQQAQMAGLAGQQVGQQANAIQGYNSAAQGLQGNLLNSINSQNNANVGLQSNINSANAGMAQTNANNTAKADTGLMSGVSKALPVIGSMFAANGGMVAPNPKIAAVAKQDRFSGAMDPHVEHLARIFYPEKFALGGAVQNQTPNAQLGTDFIPNSSPISDDSKDPSKKVSDSEPVSEYKGGKVNALVSPGEVYLPPSKAKEVAKEGKNPIKEGEKIPGKPQVKGDSIKNDVVPKKLEEGGIVIPNSIMQSDDPSGNAAKFVAKLVEKNGGSKDHKDFKEALKMAIKNRKAS